MSTALVQGHKTAYRRLLVGFNHHVECRDMLGLAAPIAEVAEVELAGVFVEDQELLDLARLPFTTEILRSSHQSRILESTNVERDLRALADILQKALRAVAERARRQFSFRTVRGHLWHEIIAQAGAGDLILLRTACYPWWGANAGGAGLNGPVVLIEAPGGGNGNLAGLAREIAGAMRQQLVIQHGYGGPQSLRNLKAGLIMVPASMFNGDIESSTVKGFVDAATCPVLIALSGRADPSG